MSKQEILERIVRDKLVEGAPDLKKQLQPASLDLTLARVFALEDIGALDFDNSRRVIPRGREIPFEKEWIELAPGAYRIQFNEAIRLPSDIAALSVSRSSLARCGALVHVGWWDPGYHGRGEACLVVGGRGLRLRSGARIAQMIFVRLSEASRELYSGIHLKENL